MKLKKQLIAKKKLGRVLVGMFVVLMCMQLLVNLGVPLLQKYVASHAPNPPSQASMVSEKVETGKQLK